MSTAMAEKLSITIAAFRHMQITADAYYHSIIKVDAHNIGALSDSLLVNAVSVKHKQQIGLLE